MIGTSGCGNERKRIHYLLCQLHGESTFKRRLAVRTNRYDIDDTTRAFLPDQRRSKRPDDPGIPAHGSDEAFDKRMRPGDQRHRLHGLNVQNPEIGLPTLELDERVVIEAQSQGQALAADGLVEHAAERDSVHGSRLHAKTDDAPAELIHSRNQNGLGHG